MFHKPASKAAHAEPPAAGFKVSDVAIGRPDAAGVTVEMVYVKRPPRYAVYRTEERVVVHYADSPALAGAQASALAKLSPLRGEINGLIDGWRTSRIESKRARARCFDRLVADALTVALEGDQACAEVLLVDVKTNIKAMRVSWARFLYLIYASAAAAAVCVAAGVAFSRGWASLMDPRMWLVASAGAVGAFFSIAVAIRSRTVLPDLRWLDNLADAVLRVVIGVIAAVMLILLLKSEVVTSGLAQGGGAAILQTVELAVVIAFTAGFLERLVPDLLEKSTLVSLGRPAASPAAAQRDAARAPATTLAMAEAHAQDEPAEDEDACVCGEGHAAEEATADHELPVAVGGVAKAA